MMGEIKGQQRPENSLLEVDVDVDRSSKPAPIITMEYTSTVEELIKHRIKDGIFDDVIFRRPAPAAEKSGDDAELSQEKSAVGLGQLYEDEFLGKTLKVAGSSANKANQKELALVEEVTQLYEKVSRQLDALSHFYYTPKPVVVEATVKSLAVPSLTLEDVTPAMMSAARAVAPEEVTILRNRN